MLDLAFLQHKLQQAPAGFGHTDVGQWLQDIPHIQSLAEIKPIFSKDLSTKELFALVALLKHRYIKDGPAYNLFEDHFEAYTKHNKLEDFYQALYLYHDNSQQLDFSLLTILNKLIVSASPSVTTIKLATNSQLEALELSYLPQFETVQDIEQASQLSYLAINHCPKLEDFRFIKKLKKLLWLDLSGNSQLTELNFLLASSQLVFLQLLDTQLLDNPKTIKQLLKLKHLKYLTITGKQSQIAELRTQLPNCVVNGMSALKNKSTLTLQ